MIDEDDVSFVALLASGGRGWVSGLLFILVVSVVAYVACENTKECAAQACPSGRRAALLAHHCVCVDPPSPVTEDD